MQAELRAEQRMSIEVALDEFFGDGTEFTVVGLGRVTEAGTGKDEQNERKFHRK